MIEPYSWEVTDTGMALINAELDRLRADLAERDAWIAGAVEALNAVEQIQPASLFLPFHACCDRYAKGGHAPECLLHKALTTIPGA